MKKYAIISVLISLVVITGLIIKKRKDRQVQGLGKVVPGRPPRVRIVYSKKLDPKDRIQITNSNDAYNILKDIWSRQIETREEMIVLLLDRSNSVLGYHLLSMGGITGTVADTRLVFSVALNALSTSIILSHNHPSGNLKPSDSDIRLTQKVKAAGQTMDIQVLDHIIITSNGYYSLADEGQM